MLTIILMILLKLLYIYIVGVIMTFIICMVQHCYETYYKKVYCHKSMSLYFSMSIFFVYSLMWPSVMLDLIKKDK